MEKQRCQWILVVLVVSLFSSTEESELTRVSSPYQAQHHFQRYYDRVSQEYYYGYLPVNLARSKEEQSNNNYIWPLLMVFALIPVFYQ